ncbi:MAG TPA: polysaccharide deacetylase family protein [Rectinemataceae bacterium]|nr:polysaccharide deacetylase family protein [Rectinemataceae bacterium]
MRFPIGIITALVLILAGIILAPAASGLQPKEGPPPTEARVGLGSSLAGLPSSPLPRELGDRAQILCWHSFLGQSSIVTDFSLEELAKQLDALLALGYRFVSLDDLLAGRIRGSMNLVATLDDGHRTVPAAFAKVFAPRGIVPAIMVYPSIIGNVPYAMDEAQLRYLRDSGCLVGAHGYHHLFVNEELYRTDRASFDQEVYRAKARVEDLTKRQIYVYAYPFGAYSEITKREVARAGYDFGLAVAPGFVYADSRLNDRYALPRIVVRRDGWEELYAFLQRNAALSRGLEAAIKTTPGQGG